LVKDITFSLSLLTGFTSVSTFTYTTALCPGEHGDAVIQAGGTAARVEVLHILFQCHLQVGQLRAQLLGWCA